jgi:hypothetical protein
MADVLLVASRKDYYTASKMQEVLGAHGLAADLQDFVTGASVDLEGRIAGARTVVFFWSKDADSAAEMRRKLGTVALALASGNVLVVQLDGTELPVGLRDLESVAVNWGPRPRRDDYEALARQIVKAMPRADKAPRAAAPSAAAPQTSARPMAAKGGGWLPVILGIGAVAVVSLAVIGYSWKPASLPLPGRDSDPLLPLLAVAGTIAAGAYGVSRQRRRREEPAQERAREAARQKAPEPESPPDVFISYSRKDAAFAGELVRALEAAGRSVWIDTRSASESRYAGPIVRALRSCRTVALICSKNSFGSDHVMRELYLAGDFRKPMVAVQIDATDFPDDFAYFLTGFPRIEAASRRIAEIASEMLGYVAGRGP